MLWMVPTQTLHSVLFCHRLSVKVPSKLSQGGPKRLRFVDCSQRNGPAKVIRHIMHSDAEFPGSPVFASSPFSGCLQLILKQSLSPRCNKQPHTQKKEQGQAKDLQREKPSSRKVTVNVSSEQEKRLAISCQSSSKFTV